MNTITVVMLYYPSLPDILKSIFAVPNVGLMNIMACRVFRNTILFCERDMPLQVPQEPSEGGS